MAIDYTQFIHPLDRDALAALKAVPGFDLVFKTWMNIYGEKMKRISITSSCIKLGPNQLPEIYNILLKVCDKLEMDVPELYLLNDRTINAYTTGETDVFIVLHTGLLETMSLDEIETVIAHECGHILCHHLLYHQMATFVLENIALFTNGLISQVVIGAVALALQHWFRCSEFSADRVAVYYHESPKPVIKTMMSLSGAYPLMQKYSFDLDSYTQQVNEYKSYISNDALLQFLEFTHYFDHSHPLTVYRASEANDFWKKYSVRSLTIKPTDEETTKEYHNVIIKYEFINPKNLLKIGAMFSNDELSVIIGKIAFTLEKGEEREILLASGPHIVFAGNNSKTINIPINLSSDQKITIVYDSENEDLYLKPEE